MHGHIGARGIVVIVGRRETNILMGNRLAKQNQEKTTKRIFV